MAATERQRRARVPPALAWKHPGRGYSCGGKVQPEPLKPRSRSKVRLGCLVAGLLALITVIASIDIETVEERWLKDPEAEATRICKLHVQDGLDRARLSTPTFAPFTMKWIDTPPSFAGRGVVTALNRAGLPVTD